MAPKRQTRKQMRIGAEELGKTFNSSLVIYACSDGNKFVKEDVARKHAEKFKLKLIEVPNPHYTPVVLTNKKPTRP